jgi:hypothetical protein
MAADPKVQGAALLEKLKGYNAAADPGQHLANRPNAEAGSEAAQFPARYYEPDPGDDVAALKGQLASAARPAPVTDSDVSAILRKRAAVEVAKQENWFQNSWTFNSSDPNKQRWAASVFPEYFNRREQVIDEQTMLQNALAKIKLRGPRSREDIDLLYAIDMGIVDPDKNAIWDIKGTNLNSPRRGLFNPLRLKIGDKQALLQPLGNPLTNFPGTGAPFAPGLTASGVQGTGATNAELAGFGIPAAAGAQYMGPPV